MIEIQRIVHIQCIQFYEFGHRQTPMHHHNEDNRHIQHFPKFYWTPCLVLVVKTLNLSFTLNTFFFFFFRAQYCIVSSWYYVAKQITRIFSLSITESLCPFYNSFLPLAVLAIAIVFSTTMNLTTLENLYM